MGFNKFYLPDIDKLKAWAQEDENSLLTIINKSECFIGPKESCEFMNKWVRTKKGNSKL